MTESDAKKKLCDHIEYLKHSWKPHPDYDVLDAMKLAIKALEKQIPKKPHKNFENFSGVWCSCGKYLGKGYFVDKPIYCSDCGQKLDWSDEE